MHYIASHGLWTSCAKLTISVCKMKLQISDWSVGGKAFSAGISMDYKWAKFCSNQASLPCSMRLKCVYHIVCLYGILYLRCAWYLCRRAIRSNLPIFNWINNIVRAINYGTEADLRCCCALSTCWCVFFSLLLLHFSLIPLIANAIEFYDLSKRYENVDTIDHLVSFY